MATVSQFCINGIDYDVKDKRVKTEREKQNIIIDPFKEGESVYGNKSVSIGYDNVAGGEGSVALGIGTKATGNYQTVIGKYNSDDTQSAFIIGNGTDDDNRSQLFNVNQNGRVVTRGPADAMQGASFVTVLNNINDSQADDLSSAIHWGDGFCIADNTETVRSFFRHNDTVYGQGLQLETRRYMDNNSGITHGLHMMIDKNGTPRVIMDYPAAWRKCLGLDTASNTITNTGDAASWRTGLKLDTASNAVTNTGGAATWRTTLGLNTASNVVTNTGGAATWRTALELNTTSVAVSVGSGFQIGSGGSFIVKKSGNVVTMYMFKLSNKSAITNGEAAHTLGTITNAAYRPSVPVFGTVACGNFSGGMTSTSYAYLRIGNNGVITFENEGYALAAGKFLSGTITYVV